MREIEILHAVVQQKRVGIEVFDGEAAAFHAVLVHHHRDPVEIAGEHERLVAGEFGIEQQGAAGGNDFRHALAGNQLALGQFRHFWGLSSFLLL